MRKMMKYGVVAMIAVLALPCSILAQKIDEERMRRDIAVAENVLATLIKHEINQQRTFFGLEVKGNYQQGYGVTFRVPGDYSIPLIVRTKGAGATTVYGGGGAAPAVVYEEEISDRARRAATEKEVAAGTYQLEGKKLVERKHAGIDSARQEYNNRVIGAARDFILDYGDFISQLAPGEKIVVTNQRENRSYYFVNNKRTHLMVEGVKSDVTAFKQGKITREQALKKLKIVNTETIDEKETDMELLASIFNRLYRPDLSTTYFSENNMYYERLKDYGVIFYMEVFSSTGDKVKTMPTQAYAEMDAETRNRKVTELYPKFEKELKENIIEYGRTLKSLKENETLVFNVKLTKCEGCGIPSTLELALRKNVLDDFSAGKMDKNAAVAQFLVKKGPDQ